MATMGRPTKRSPARFKTILTAIAGGNTRTAACGLAGIGLSTLADWERDFPDFSEALKKAEAEAEAAMVAAVKRAVPENWTAAAWWLERRRTLDWGRKDTLLILQQAAKQMEKLSNDELLAIALGDADSAADGEGDSVPAGDHCSNGHA